MTTPGDEELLRQMMAGDEDAFVALYRRRQGAIYRFALNMSGNATIAEEVTQEVFLALIREGRQYDPKRGPVAAYLFGIARNQVLRCLERERPYVAIEEEPEAPQTASYDTIDTVRRAVLALPPNYREAVVLCDLQEMSYAEAAQILHCAVGTVRSRLHRGRALLLQKLGNRMRSNPARCLV